MKEKTLTQKQALEKVIKAHGQSRAAAPTGRAPSPGARFAPHSAPARKPKNDQQKENTTWKTGKKKK